MLHKVHLTNFIILQESLMRSVMWERIVPFEQCVLLGTSLDLQSIVYWFDFFSSAYMVGKTLKQTKLKSVPYVDPLNISVDIDLPLVFVTREVYQPFEVQFFIWMWLRAFMYLDLKIWDVHATEVAKYKLYNFLLLQSEAISLNRLRIGTGSLLLTLKAWSSTCCERSSE